MVDEGGNPLSDVEIEIRKRAPATDEDCTWLAEFLGKVKVNGSFALRVDDADQVALEFRRPGYYLRKENFLRPQPSPERAREISEIVLTGRKPPPRQSVQKWDLRIVMEKQGKMTRLAHGCCGLSFYRDGHGDVLQIMPGARGMWVMTGSREVWIEPPGHLPEKSVLSHTAAGRAIEPPGHLPEKCVYMLPKTDAKGRFEMLKLSTMESPRAREAMKRGHPLFSPDDERLYVYVPAEVRLVVNDPQGGFLRYEPKPGREIRLDHPWLCDMKEAPPEGYTHELVLDSKAIKKLFADPVEPQPVFFYIKAYGKYGKGQLDWLKIILKEAFRKYVDGELEPFHYVLDDSRLVGAIQIFVQPDGSRNLEGEDEW